MTEYDLTKKKPKHKPEEYVGIRVWGQTMGSYAYYIENEQRRASEDGAPVDAIHERTGLGGEHTGKWMTVSNLAPDHEFRRIYAEALEKEKK
jgi:hypothetical protein